MEDKLTPQLAENLATLLGSLVVFALLFGAYWYVAKQANKKKLTIGEYITKYLLSSHITWVVGILVLINISEGVFAASIQDEAGMNPIARLMTHLSIAGMGIFLAIATPKQISNSIRVTWEWLWGLISFVKVMRKRGQTALKRKETEKFAKMTALYTVHGLVAVVTLGGAIMLPALNLSIIANGLDQMTQLTWAIYDKILMYDLTAVYASHPDVKVDPRIFSPLNHAHGGMSYQMYASFALVLVHYILAFLDGLYALLQVTEEEGPSLTSSATRRATNAPPNDLTQAQYDQVENNLENVIEKVVSKLTTMRGNDRTNFVTDIFDHIEQTDDDDELIEYTRTIGLSSARIDKIQENKDNGIYDNATYKTRMREEARRFANFVRDKMQMTLSNTKINNFR